MQPMKKWILASLAITLIIGVGVGYYLYNKPLESMAGKKAEVALSATDLYAAFDLDEQAANAKYLGKVIEVSGTVVSVSAGDDGTPSVLLDSGGAMGGVICRMDASLATAFQEGQQITLRGECTGKLLDVELARCVVAE